MQFWMSVLSIFISLILATQCNHLAKRKGRHPAGWFVAGAAFGIFALILLALLPTRRTTQMLKTKMTSAPEPVFQALCILQADRFWYFLDENKKQYGPMSFSALKSAWNEGTVQGKTFVWNEEMENWRPLQDVVRFE